MKSNKIVYWVLTGLISLVFIGSALGKLTANEESLKMASNFGLDSATFTFLGILELACVILFIIPRTGIIGTMLLAAYMCHRNTCRTWRVNFGTMHSSIDIIFNSFLSIS